MKNKTLNFATYWAIIGVLEACSMLKNKSSSSEFYTDPVCNMKVEKNNSFDYKYKGEAYHFDSHNCKETFKMAPEKFTRNTSNLTNTDSTSIKFYIDPVCNMKIEKGSSYDYKYKGEAYHFDNYNCRETFKMSPEKFIKNKCDSIK